MKQVILSVWASTSLTATGIMIALTGVEVYAAQAIGPATPIAGFTLASVSVLLASGIGFAFVGGKMMIQIGRFLEKLTRTVDKASRFGDQVKALSERSEEQDARIESIERWRQNVDPTIKGAS